MRLKWTSKAVLDLSRLHEFLAQVNPRAATEVVQLITKAVSRLCENPYLGPKLHEFEGREVRHIMIKKYEVRYEIYEKAIYILRLWHHREDR